MANYCFIRIYLPLRRIPDEIERRQLAALYEARKKHAELSKENDELRTGRNYDEFIASQPGIPYQRTRWSHSGGEFEGRSGEVLLPDSRQWNRPTVRAHFEERYGETWVHPFHVGSEEPDGITISPPNGASVPLRASNRLQMTAHYKYCFPWWAQVGFAGAEKFCDQESLDVHTPDVYLYWRQTVANVTANLRYSIDILKAFVQIVPTQQAMEERIGLEKPEEVFRWFTQVQLACPEAFAELDWSEVVSMGMTFKDARENNDPNEIMAAFAELEQDMRNLQNWKISQGEFEQKYRDDSP